MLTPDHAIQPCLDHFPTVIGLVSSFPEDDCVHYTGDGACDNDGTGVDDDDGGVVDV